MKAEASEGPRPRRFEFRDGGSAKFWEIVREDDTYTVTYGRIGSSGRSLTKELDDEEDVARAVQKLIAEKLAGGYVEVGGVPAVAGHDWTRLESWRALRDAIAIKPVRWGKPATMPTEEQIDAFETAEQFPLPPSYRAFLRVFGPGDLTLFQVAAPGGPEHYSLEALADEARKRIAVEAIDFASDEFVGLAPVARMVVFCSWDSDRWGWDRDERDGNGEYVIRRWHRSHPVAEKVADSFPEFVIDKLLLNGMFQLDAPDDPSFTPAAVQESTTKPTRGTRAKPSKAEPARTGKRSAGEENEHLRRIASDPSDLDAQAAYADWLDRYQDPIADVIRARLKGEAVRKVPAKQPFLDLGILPWALARLGARIRPDDAGRIAHAEIQDYQVNAETLREFATYPALRELELIHHEFTAEEVQALGGVRSVTELHLHDIGLGDEGFQSLTSLSNLETLCLLRPSSSGPGLAHLNTLPKLETLILDAAPDRVEAHLASLSSWPVLKAIFLSRSNLPGRALAALGRLKQVERLGLDGNPIRDDDLAHLAGLHGLKWLDIEETEITGVGLKHLEGLRTLEALKTRELSAADEAARSIALLSGLQELAIPGSYERRFLTDAGLAHLATLATLQRLNVSCQQITDEGLERLAVLVELEELDLSENRGILGHGLEFLKGLPKLRRLNLESTGLTDATVPILKEFTSLEELSLRGTGIGDRKLASLRKALPRANL